MAVLERGSLFAPELVGDLINKVKGKSSLAVLSKQEPIPFNGSKEFVFTMDSEVDIVAESGAKSHGGITVSPVTIVPIKIEYGARISDEFLYSAEEEQLNILKAFNDGFAKKVARGLDLMAMHGVNPRTGAASAVVGTNYIDSRVTTRVNYTSATPDDNVESAVAKVQGTGGDVTGMALSPTFSAALAAYKVNNVKVFPELSWGANPGAINGLPIDINKTVSDMSLNDRAIVGDFANSFKWGYAKEVPLEIIKYGDPDNTSSDLRGHNQVYLRAEIFLGWGILDETAFARIVEPEVVTMALAQAGGTTGSVPSTAITLTFDTDIIGLKAEHVTLTNGTGTVAKGALTGSGKVYSLAVTTTKQGTVAVEVARLGGYTFPASANVTVFFG